MSALDTPLKRFKFLLDDTGIKQITLAKASGLTSGGISDMLKNHVSFKAVIGLKKLKPNVNVDWITNGQSGPYLETTGAYLDGLIDQSKLLIKIQDMEDRLLKLETNNNAEEE